MANAITILPIPTPDGGEVEAELSLEIEQDDRRKEWFSVDILAIHLLERYELCKPGTKVTWLSREQLERLEILALHQLTALGKTLRS